MAPKDPNSLVRFGDLLDAVNKAVDRQVTRIASAAIASLATDGLVVAVTAAGGLTAGKVVAVTGTTTKDGAQYPTVTQATDSTQAGSLAPMGIMVGGVDGSAAPANDVKVHVRTLGVVYGISGSPTVGDPVFVDGSGNVTLTPGAYAAGLARCIGRVIRAGGGNYDFWVNGHRADESQYWLGAKAAVLRYRSTPSSLIECSVGFATRGIHYVGAEADVETTVEGASGLLQVFRASRATMVVRDPTNNIELSVGVDNAAGAGFISTNTNHPLKFYVNSIEQSSVSSNGLAVPAGKSVTINGAAIAENTGFITVPGIIALNGALGLRISAFLDITAAGSVVAIATQVNELSLHANAGAGSFVRIQANGAERFRANNTGIGFFGVTPVARSATYSVTNPTTDRALNVTGDTLAQGLQVLGTLILDLQLTGIIG